MKSWIVKSKSYREMRGLTCNFAAVEAVLGMSRNDFYGSGKNAQAVMAKEVLILTGRQTGASFPQLANLTGLDPSTVSRRYEAAKRKARSDTKLDSAKGLTTNKYCTIASLTPSLFDPVFLSPSLFLSSVSERLMARPAIFE